MDATDSFGYWVRQRRRALDLTQEVLAQRVGCAAVTLRKIEADQRRPSPQMARRLAECLALPDEEYPDFVAAAVGQRGSAHLPSPARTGPRARTGNLPAPLTATFGRAMETAAVAALLRERTARLLTLTGPVGVGKTRLALEVGQMLRDDYRDGVHLIALESLQDPDLTPSATARALCVRETRDLDMVQSIASYLGESEALLIFDNFEHLLPAAPFLSQLLSRCPRIQILVTSRTRLRLYGEFEFVVQPLPAPDQSDLTNAARSSSVQLFCDRAQAACTDFQPTPSLTPMIAEICRRLDGLPLAIELAAARLKLLSLQELHGRMGCNLPLLSQGADDAPSHLRGLESAIAWSYGLLRPTERALLARLAVFVGGFSLPAAEAVCAAADPPAGFNGQTGSPAVAVDQCIDSLLCHSLLVRNGVHTAASLALAECCGKCPLRALRESVQAETRYAMLGIIREFALARLEESGELNAVQRRHAHYFAGWAKQAEARLNGPDQATWLTRLELEIENLRAALSHLLATDDVAAAAGMACSLAAFWQRHGHYSEGRRWLEQILERMPPSAAPDPLRARTLQAVATLAYRQGDWPTAQRWLDESLAHYRTLNDRAGMARVLFDLGWIAVDKAEWAEAARLNRESLALARELDDPHAAYQALTNLGWAQLCFDAWDQAAAHFDEAFQLAQGMGHSKGIAVSLANLGWIALHRREASRAIALAQHSLRVCYSLGERELVAECLDIQARAAAIEGNAPLALELEGAAEALWNTLSVNRPPTLHVAASGRPLETATPPAGGRVADLAWLQGRPASLDAVVASALGCGGAPVQHLA